MAQELTPDICIIGTGAGALVAATAAASFGVPVVLVAEPGTGETLGANHALARVAFVAAAGNAGTDFSAIRQRVQGTCEAVAPLASRRRLTGLGVQIVSGTPHFQDARTLAVEHSIIRPRRFIVAARSSPAVPAIPGLAETPHVTADAVLDLTECPRRLIIIGAGPAGLELAQAFRRLGAAVTVLDPAPPLAGSDSECAAIVLDALVREGVDVRAPAAIVRVRRVVGRVQAEIETPRGVHTVEGTQLLLAAGRRSDIEHLDLDAAGIAYTPSGITVDKNFLSTNKRVYAIGAAARAPDLRDLAEHQAGLAIRHALFRLPAGLRQDAVPAVISTDPELAQVGMLEDQARAKAGVIRVLRAPYLENDRAQIAGAVNGHVKIITNRRGRILGASIVGRNAGADITAWTLAISQGLNIRAIAGLMVPYPATAEVGKRAAYAYFMRGLTSARVRRIIGWLRRLG
jgi:pyruvate/2-oxoglutarate dehydrogenase complex dihydrolipoamide dehydrogenase (E3) component